MKIFNRKYLAEILFIILLIVIGSCRNDDNDISGCQKKSL